MRKWSTVTSLHEPLLVKINKSLSLRILHENETDVNREVFPSIRIDRQIVPASSPVPERHSAGPGLETGLNRKPKFLDVVRFRANRIPFGIGSSSIVGANAKPFPFAHLFAYVTNRSQSTRTARRKDHGTYQPPYWQEAQARSALHSEEETHGNVVDRPRSGRSQRMLSRQWRNSIVASPRSLEWQTYALTWSRLR